MALRRNVVRPLVTARWPAAAEHLASTPGGGWPPWIPDSLAVRVDLEDIIRESTRPAPFDGAARTLRYQRVFMPQGARIAVLRERTRARTGMAFADPFSDRRLVELVLSMPQWLVQRRGQPKRLVRRSMSGVMPEPARVGARKTIPYGLFDRGFRDRAVPVVQDLLTSSRAAEHGWLDERAARAVYDEYLTTGDSYWDFWWPLTVEMWLRRWWS
jgi:asparagine synthase (glutamine-hydrolysing)